MLRARPSRHLPRLIRLRAMPLAAALLLGAALLPAIPFTGSATPINFLDAKGDWVPIDNPLADDSGGLTNAANAFGLHFPSTLSPDAPIGVDLPQGSYTFSLQGGKATATDAKAGDDHVTYPE